MQEWKVRYHVPARCPHCKERHVMVYYTVQTATESGATIRFNRWCYACGHKYMGRPKRRRR